MKKYIKGFYEVELLNGDIIKLGELSEREAKVLFKLADKLNGVVFYGVGLSS